MTWVEYLTNKTLFPSTSVYETPTQQFNGELYSYSRQHDTSVRNEPFTNQNERESLTNQGYGNQG